MSFKQESKINGSPTETTSAGRRKLVKMLLAAGPAISLMGINKQALAQEGAQKVPESDPVAVALGYVEDTSKVDAAKYPAHKPGDICKDCLLYTDPTAAEWGPCTLFQNRLVAANGWCVSFAKRPA